MSYHHSVLGCSERQQLSLWHRETSHEHQRTPALPQRPPPIPELPCSHASPKCPALHPNPCAAQSHGRSYESPGAGNVSFAQASVKSESSHCRGVSYFSLRRTLLPKHSGKQGLMRGRLHRAKLVPLRLLYNRPLALSPGHTAQDMCKSCPSLFHLSYS